MDRSYFLLWPRHWWWWDGENGWRSGCGEEWTLMSSASSLDVINWRWVGWRRVTIMTWWNDSWQRTHLKFESTVGSDGEEWVSDLLQKSWGFVAVQSNLFVFIYTLTPCTMLLLCRMILPALHCAWRVEAPSLCDNAQQGQTVHLAVVLWTGKKALHHATFPPCHSLTTQV